MLHLPRLFHLRKVVVLDHDALLEQERIVAKDDARFAAKKQFDLRLVANYSLVVKFTSSLLGIPLDLFRNSRFGYEGSKIHARHLYLG